MKGFYICQSIFGYDKSIVNFASHNFRILYSYLRYKESTEKSFGGTPYSDVALSVFIILLS